MRLLSTVIILSFTSFCILKLLIGAVLKCSEKSQSESYVTKYIKQGVSKLLYFKKVILNYLIENKRASISSFIVITFIFSQIFFFYNEWAIGFLGLAVGLTILVWEVLFFVRHKNFLQSKKFSSKTFASGMQEYIKETQFWFFIGAITWVFFLTLKVYSYVFLPTLVAIFFFSIFYGLFWVCEIKEIPMLKILMTTAFVSTWLCFAFANSFGNIIFLASIFLLFMAFKDSPSRQKTNAYVTKLSLPQIILNNHYKIELFFLKF